MTTLDESTKSDLGTGVTWMQPWEETQQLCEQFVTTTPDMAAAMSGIAERLIEAAAEGVTTPSSKAVLGSYLGNPCNACITPYPAAEMYNLSIIPCVRDLRELNVDCGWDEASGMTMLQFDVYVMQVTIFGVPFHELSDKQAQSVTSTTEDIKMVKMPCGAPIKFPAGQHIASGAVEAAIEQLTSACRYVETAAATEGG